MLAGRAPSGRVIVPKYEIMNDPMMLMSSVPHGNDSPANRATATAIQ
jgi:hypothetical protein